MSSKPEIPSNLQQLKKYSSKLFEDIDKSPGSFSTQTNPIVAPIYSAWEATHTGEIKDADLKLVLESPQSFVENLAPKKTKHEKDQILRGLAHRVGIFMDTDKNNFGIRTITKKGRFARASSAPEGDNWEKTHSDDWNDTFIRKDVLEEATREVELDLLNTGFHATTSAALPGIEKRKALVSSQKIREDGEQAKSGEALGSRFTRRHVFVAPGAVHDAYGIPAWFNEHEVVFGVDLDKQSDHIKSTGQEMGIWSLGEGYEIGSEVPLKNLNLISAPASHLEETKKWAEKNAPGVPVVSREYLELKRKRR